MYIPRLQEKNVSLDSTHIMVSPDTYIIGSIFFTVCILLEGVRKLKFLSLKKKNSDCFIAIDEVPQHDELEVPHKLNKIGIKKDISICLNNFIKTLKQRPHIDLSNFYRNFHAFCIQKKKKRISFILGSFYPKRDNQELHIEIYTNLSDALYHELLHMASTRTGKDFEAIGFQRIKWNGKEKEYIIGKGINEGYTEYLAKRYFRKSNEPECYPNMVIISSVLEMLVGQEKMESLYFKGDLLGLINELSQYLPQEEVIRLIRNIDIYLYMKYNFNYYSNKSKKEIYGEIILTIAKIMIKQIETSSDTSDIEKENAYMDFIGKHRFNSETMTPTQIGMLEKIMEEYNSKLDPPFISSPIKRS